MPVIHVRIDDKTYETYKKESRDTQRSINWLAAKDLAEAASKKVKWST